MLPGPPEQAQARSDPELAIGRTVQGVRVAPVRDGVRTEMSKAVAIVAEKAALRADPKETFVVLVQGKNRGIGQAQVGSVHLEFPMLRLRRQGTEQPTRTENPDTRPHTHSHWLSVESARHLRSVRRAPWEGDSSIRFELAWYLQTKGKSSAWPPFRFRNQSRRFRSYLRTYSGTAISLGRRSSGSGGWGVSSRGRTPAQTGSA